MKLILDLLIWVTLWYLVKYAGITGNPLLLLFVITMTFILIVVKQTHIPRKNGD